MPSFGSGVVKFQSDVFPGMKDLFEKLGEGQSPEALFITCADSRIETAMITQTDPGELFICRNAGNIVPPHTNDTGGMTASIEFAVSALKVPHVVILGHSGCGAIKGALHPEGLDALPHMKDWLGYARAAVEVVDILHPDASDEVRETALIEQNVVLQLQHLRTHPAVAARIAKQDIKLHGWVYDIPKGEVRFYDEADGIYHPLTERYQADGSRRGGSQGA